MDFIGGFIMNMKTRNIWIGLGVLIIVLMTGCTGGDKVAAGSRDIELSRDDVVKAIVNTTVTIEDHQGNQGLEVRLFESGIMDTTVDELEEDHGNYRVQATTRYKTGGIEFDVIHQIDFESRENSRDELVVISKKTKVLEAQLVYMTELSESVVMKELTDRYDLPVASDEVIIDCTVEKLSDFNQRMTMNYQVEYVDFSLSFRAMTEYDYFYDVQQDFFQWQMDSYDIGERSLVIHNGVSEETIKEQLRGLRLDQVGAKNHVAGHMEYDFEVDDYTIIAFDMTESSLDGMKNIIKGKVTYTKENCVLTADITALFTGYLAERIDGEKLCWTLEQLEHENYELSYIHEFDLEIEAILEQILENKSWKLFSGIREAYDLREDQQIHASIEDVLMNDDGEKARVYLNLAFYHPESEGYYGFDSKHYIGYSAIDGEDISIDYVYTKDGWKASPTDMITVYRIDDEKEMILFEELID